MISSSSYTKLLMTTNVNLLDNLTSLFLKNIIYESYKLIKIYNSKILPFSKLILLKSWIVKDLFDFYWWLWSLSIVLHEMFMVNYR